VQHHQGLFGLAREAEFNTSAKNVKHFTKKTKGNTTSLVVTPE